MRFLGIHLMVSRRLLYDPDTIRGRSLLGLGSLARVSSRNLQFSRVITVMAATVRAKRALIAGIRPSTSMR